MKSSASVDPASRSTGTYSPKIQEPEIRQMELASAPPSATSRIDSAPDPAFSPLGRAPVRHSSGKTPGAPSADPEKGAQAFGVQPPASSSEAKAASAPQHPPSTSRVAQSHPEHASAQSHPSRSTLEQTSNEITRSKSARDLEMEFHKFARRAGKNAKDLV
ncbi:type III effector protein XopAB [Xanthomonas axonopodis pv. vasculorum]|nr:type III effector protein XopAB [Xanthomonas axonopodis]